METKKRAIILTGSADRSQFYNTYADGSTYSAIFQNLPRLGDISSSIASTYESLTGKTTKWYETYDIQITLDKQHQKTPYSSYVWIDKNGTFMETPILFENDKVVLGRRTGLFKLGFEPLMTLPIGGSTPLPETFQKLFKN